MTRTSAVRQGLGDAPPHAPRRAARAFLVLFCLLVATAALSGCSGGDRETSEQPVRRAADESSGSPNPLAERSPLESDAGGATGGAAGDPFGGSEAVSPEPQNTADLPDASGAWSGTITDDTGAEGRLEFSVGQQGATLSATGVLTSDDEPQTIEPLTGTVDDTGAVSLVYRAADGNGIWSFDGTLDGESISGESTLTLDEGPDQAEPDRATFFLSRASTE